VQVRLRNKRTRKARCGMVYLTESGILGKTFSINPDSGNANNLLHGGSTMARLAFILPFLLLVVATVCRAEGDKKPEPIITNSVGLQLAYIPAGDFLMGSPDGDRDALAHEKPQHKVRITRPFYVGTTTVTVGQFRAFVKDSGYKTDAERGKATAWK